MRPLDELARFWNDARLRMPYGTWSWPLVVAAGAATVVLIGAGTSEVVTGPHATLATTPAVVAPAACQDQTWPYLSDACIRPNRPADTQAAQTPATKVRVLDYEPAMAQAAIGATPWAPKDTSAFRPPQARHKQPARKQAAPDPGRSRTVTVRSGRREGSERVYAVPEGAYRAYGYAPR